MEEIALMFVVNRSALLVKRKNPYIDWANALDEDGPRLSLDEPMKDSTVYLVDEIGYHGDAQEVIRKYYSTIFEQELVAWHLVEKDWPQKRDLKTFQDWFEVEAHSMVLDICEYAFEFEEFAA